MAVFELQYFLHNRFWRAMGLRQAGATAISQSRHTLCFKTFNPLVARVTGNVEAFTELSNTRDAFKPRIDK
jgi:hypothetical protein